MAAAAKARTFSPPGLFWGKRELKPMTFRALMKVAVLMERCWVETNQCTPSEQGGVVKEPEYLFSVSQVPDKKR